MDPSGSLKPSFNRLALCGMLLKWVQVYIEWKQHVNHLRDAVAVNAPDLEHQPHVDLESDSDDLPTVPLTLDVPHPLVEDPSEDPPPWRYPVYTHSTSARSLQVTLYKCSL